MLWPAAAASSSSRAYSSSVTLVPIDLVRKMAFTITALRIRESAHPRRRRSSGFSQALRKSSRTAAHSGRGKTERDPVPVGAEPELGLPLPALATYPKKCSPSQRLRRLRLRRPASMARNSAIIGYGPSGYIGPRGSRKAQQHVESRALCRAQTRA